MRELKGDWRDLFNGFMVALDLRKCFLALLGIFVTIFFCGGGGRPNCPGASGTVTGTITALDVLPVPAQGIAGGDLDAVLRGMRAGVTYANMHTAAHPGGEIRGQIVANDGEDDDQGEQN